MTNFQIKIEGLSNPQKFVDQWSNVYKYKLEYKYINNIERGFETDDTLLELMRWKNGTGDRISGDKMKPVDFFLSKRDILKGLKENFSYTEFESQFQPEKSSSIWKIFLLHILSPDNHPIFDQHVYRSFNFFRCGKIEELPNTRHKEVYRIYKDEYLPWFNELKVTYGIEPRKIDKSFFSFGRVLKTLKDAPIKVKF